MRYLMSNALLDGGFEKQITPGIYQSLLITLSGINIDEQTVGHSDFTFAINYNGQQIMRLPGAFLLEYNKQKYGFPKVTSTENSTFELTAIIDFEFLGVENCLHVTPSDVITFELKEESGVATKVASGTCYVDGVLGSAPQNYIPRLLPADRSPGGASSPRDRLPYRNIATVWINGTYITNVVLEEDGETKFTGTYSRAISLTSLQERLESAAASYAKFNLASNFADLLNNDVILETTVSQADTVKIQVLSFDFDNRRRFATAQKIANQFTSRVAKVNTTAQGAMEINEVKQLASRKVGFTQPDAATATIAD